MRRSLTLVLGIVIGQWLAFGAAASPAHYHTRAQRAWRGHDYVEALQLWSHAVALQPADPNTHYLRGTALARLGLKTSALDVWTTRVVLNAGHAGRFLVDTGSSVTVVSPRLATQAGIARAGGGPLVELHTLGGRAMGAAAVVASLRVGELQLRDVPVVLHEPGPTLDGILGNTVLGRYRITVDGDRRQLQLRLLARD